MHKLQCAACRPFGTTQAEQLITGLTATMTTVTPSNINVLNIAKVWDPSLWQHAERTD